MKKRSPAQFVICLDNAKYPASLEKRKVYRVLPDVAGLKHQMIRVVDESGEDYLYPEAYFAPIQLPHAAESALLQAS